MTAKRPAAAVVLALALVAAGTAVLLVGCDEVTPDTEPGFGAQTVADQTYTVGEAIASLALPGASGGNAPLTYSLTPAVPGLSFSPSTRMLRGTPTAAAEGTHAMTYRVEDADGDAAALRFDVRVNPAPAADTEPTFGQQTVADQTYTVGEAIASLVLPRASGGNPPLSYSLTPTVPGLTFDAATRALRGTPTVAGSYPMTYRVADADENAALLKFAITVTAADGVGPTIPHVDDLVFTFGPEADDREHLSLVLPEATGTVGSYFLTLTGDYPVSLRDLGLQYDASRRLLHGTPGGYAGTYEFTYGAYYGSRGATVETTFNITIALEAGPKLYWHWNRWIWRSNLYGAGAGKVFERLGNTEVDDERSVFAPISGLALDPVENMIYWAEIDKRDFATYRIVRASISDGSRRQVVLTDDEAKGGLRGGLRGIEIDTVTRKIYWTWEIIGGERRCRGDVPVIKRANLDGSRVETIVRRDSLPDNTFRDRTCYRSLGVLRMDLDLVGERIFIASNDLIEQRVYVVNIDGTEPTKWPGLRPIMSDIAVDSSAMKLYWRNNGGEWLVGRANLDGSAVENLIDVHVSSGGEHYEQISLDIARGKMYYVSGGYVESSRDSYLERANLDGTDIEVVMDSEWEESGRSPPFDVYHGHFALDLRDDAP